VTSCALEVGGALGYSAHADVIASSSDPAISEDGLYPGGQRIWLLTMNELAAETDYAVRVWAQNECGMSVSSSATIQAATSSRPAAPTLKELHIGPNTIEVSYTVLDPEGAPISSVVVEFCRSSMFSSWEAVAAHSQTLPPADEETSQKRNDLLVSALGPEEYAQPGSAQPAPPRTWIARIEGLEKECAYQVRARAENSVGASHAPSTAVMARTTERPLPPDEVECISRLPDAVLLRYKVSDVLDTPAVTGVYVEQSGSVAWHDVADIEVQKIEADPVITTIGVTACWTVLVRLGIHPGVEQRLRLRSLNPHGRSVAPSEVCTCCTSDRAEPVTAVTCVQRLPHALVLEWELADPEGAPVSRYEVQVRKQQALATWQTRECATCYRKEPAGCRWSCMVEELEADTAYRICIRARNSVGWSDWAALEEEFQTSVLTTEGRLEAFLPAESRDQGVAEEQLAGSNGLGLALHLPEGSIGMATLDAELQDPAGAPVIACMMRCREQGTWVLATRQCSKHGDCKWRAQVPLAAAPQKGAPRTFSFELRAANAVGWTMHTYRIPQQQQPPPDESFACSAVDMMQSQVQDALSFQHEVKEHIQVLLVDATAGHDDEHANVLHRYTSELDSRLAVLEGIAIEVSPAAQHIGEEQGAQLVAQFQLALQKYKVVPNAAAAAKLLSLVLRGYMWLEQSWRPDLRAMSMGMSKLRERLERQPEGSSRILHQWARQHEIWTESFDKKVREALPEGLATAAQLLATLASGRRSELFDCVRADLVACSTLVAAAEKQLKRLQQTHRILHATEEVDSSSCHDFQRKGVRHKIESTALGIITMLVLPMPGAIEVGTFGIGMMWLEGDEAAGSHMALEHPSGTALQPFLERLGASPPPRASVIISGWANGGHKGVILVHNATPRRVVATLISNKESLATVAAARLADAHPMLRLANSTMSQAGGGDHVATILPTDVGLIQVPASKAGDSGKVRVQFAYGTAAKPEKAVGYACIDMGSAITFLSLDSSLQLHRLESQEDSDEDSFKVVNNDLSPVQLSVYRAAENRKHFESAVHSTVVQPGEEEEVPLQPNSYGSLFEVEVRYESGRKACCELRPGQCLLVDPCG